MHKSSDERTDVPRELMVLDASYTLEMIENRGLHNAIFSRDLDGYFTHVWSVHPLASMLTSEFWAPRTGSPKHHQMSERHTFIEGKVGKYNFLNKLPLLNLLIAQLQLFIQLVGIIRRGKVKLIRVGDPLYLGLFGWLLSKLTGVPMVIRVNGHNKNVRKSTGKPMYPRLLRSIAIEERIEAFIFPRAAHVIAPNADYLDFAIESGANPNEVSKLSYGNVLAKEYFDDPKQRVVDHAVLDRFGLISKKFVLTVGRLEPLKFPADVLEAFHLLAAGAAGLKLVFVGDGSMKDELARQAEALGVSKWVVFTGNVNQATLLQLYTFTLAYLSPLTGRALSEAALCAAPTIAYDLDWQADIVINEQTGLLCAPRSVDGLAFGLQRFLMEPDFACRMGTAIRAKAVSMLDPKAQDLAEIHCYEQLI